jgi:hypothetical protein
VAETLARGFRNSFPQSKGDLTLTLNEVRLELGRFNGARTRLQYKATLSNANGIVRRTAGIASRSAPMFTGSVTTESAIVASELEASVDAMYEQLAKELFRG